MQKKLLAALFSTRLMALLFLVYAVSMATGTFIESHYNTDTARIWIYNTLWFEAIHLFFLINFFGNIKKYQLLKKEKWATLLLHLVQTQVAPGRALASFDFRALKPTFDLSAFHLHGSAEGDGLAVWTTNNIGQVGVDAKVTLR